MSARVGGRRPGWPACRLSVIAPALLAAGCGSPATAVVVEIWSDLAVPGEMETVEVELTGTQTSRVRFEQARLSGADGMRVVRRLAAYPEGAEDLPLAVRVSAFKGTDEVVRQQAELRFEPDRTLLLQMYLGHSCLGLTCTEPGQTCFEGRCQPRSRRNLPRYDPNRAAPPPIDASLSDAARDGGGEPGADGAADTPGDALDAPDSADSADAGSTEAPDATDGADRSDAADSADATPTDIGLEGPDVGLDSPPPDPRDGGEAPRDGVDAAEVGLDTPATCGNSMKDGGETDVDCGGPCPPCAEGQTCLVAGDCMSGHCVDGVCCKDACAGACRACNRSGSLGTCTFETSGTDPADECPVDSTACGRDGTCDGAGACRFRPSSQLCGAASCSGATHSSAPQCNGQGTCVPGATMSCAPYGCTAGGCRTACAANSDCAPGYSCHLATGTCRSGGADGSVCVVPSDCLSGFCVDGVCCNNACTGTCRACSTAAKGYGADGICEYVEAGRDPDGDCAPGEGCSDNGVCRCADGRTNGDESDVDCGGAVCRRCIIGEACNDNPDCAESNCAAGRCCAGGCPQVDTCRRCTDCGCIEGPPGCNGGMCSGACGCP